MLSIDLFDSKFEKRLHEGAVDDAEYARLKKLGEKIDYLKQARAKTTDPEMRQAIDGRIKQYDSERREILSVRGMDEAQQPQPAPAKGLLKGKDLVTPQQRVAAATPAKTSMVGKARDTLGSFANWLAGKDDTGPTYESDLNETDENSLITRAKYVWEQIRRAHDGNVDIATIRWMDNSEPVTLSRNQLYHTVQKIKAMSRQNRNAFATQTLADRNNFFLWLGSQKKITPRPQLKQPSDPFQPELPLGKPKIGPVQERAQKKKSSDEDNIKAGDVKVARELQKLRAQYPAARSDVEAVARAEIDNTERSNQQIAAIRGANEKQDALLKQLVSLDREQGREIDSLDSENNNLEKQLAQVQATNARLQQTIGQMTGTKKSSRTSVAVPTTQIASPISSAEIDSATLKKVQDLQSQVQALQARPRTPDIEQQLKDLQGRINALPAQAAQALNIDQDKQRTGQALRPQAPAGDLDMKPAKKPTAKAKTSKSKTKTAKSKTVKPTPTDSDNDLNIVDIEEPDMFAVTEHGGGIGPRQHWQSLMRNEQAQDRTGKPMYQAKEKFLVRHNGRDVAFFPDMEQAKAAAKDIMKDLRGFASVHRVMREGEMSKIDIMRQDLKLMSDLQFMRAHGMSKAAFQQKYKTLLKPATAKDTDMQEQFAMPGTTIPRKSVIQGYTVFWNPETKIVSVTKGGDSEEAAIDQIKIGTPNLRTYRVAAEKLIDKIEDQLINEGVKDAASATAVIACLLTGGSLTGCASAPQQTSAQQVLKTGQDLGRTVQTAQRITRAGAEAEVNQEIRNLLRGIGGRPEELNNSNILRIWKKIKGAPPVQPEPQAPEYGPAPPVKRTPQYEAQEIHTRADFVKERDRLLRMITQETNPANKQILRAAIRQLESRAENEGWISIQQRMVREDNASGAAEQAILKRIMVSHRDLLTQYGPQKVMQAAEEVAYNVGDLGEIGSSDVSGWVDQVKQILGATP